MFIGGIATYVTHIAKELQKRNVTPFLIASDCSELIRAELQEQDVEYTCISLRTHDFFVRSAETIVKTFVCSFRYIRKNSPQLVILNTPFSGLGFMLALSIARKSMPVYYQFHGAVDQEIQHADRYWDSYYKRGDHTMRQLLRSLYRLVKYRTMHVVQQFVMKKTNKIFCFSRYAQKTLTEHFLLHPVSLQLVRPGIPSELTPPAKHNTGTPTLFVLSRIEPRKGLFLFLEALQTLKGLRKKFQAIIYSEYRQHSDFVSVFIKQIRKSGLENNVFLIQHVSHQNKFLLMSQADLVVLPSIDLETFGFVTLESYALGIPVCGFAIGANQELIPKQTGLLIPKKSSLALATTIDKYLSLPWVKKQHIVNRIRRELKKYKWSTYIDSLLKKQ